VKKIVLYGAVLGLLILILKYIEYKVYVKDQRMEIYMGLIALLFTVVGIWAGIKFRGKKEVVLVKEVEVVKEVPVLIDRENFVLNENLLKQLSISKREYEVLELIAGGMSNKEIADKLFVSENTIKTHSSRLFEKLDVSRRTQAVEKAKSLGLLP
jgi:DNA-binding CsgD family transcriptional regulator